MNETGKKIYPRKSETSWLWYPISFLLLVVPSIVAEHSFKNPLTDFPWYPAEEISLDLFLYWKSFLIVLVGIILLFCFIWYCKTNGRMQIKNDKKSLVCLMPLLFYGLTIVFSTIGSEYPYFSLHGSADQFESVWVLITYIVLALTSYLFIDNQKKMAQILVALFLGCLLVSFVGVGQFLGLDFYRILFKSRNYTFNFPKGQVYGPFYNPNYVGSFVALILPVFIMIFLGKREKLTRVATGLLCAMLGIMLIGSRSTTGFLITAFICLLLIVFHWRKIWSYRLYVGIALIVILGMAFLGRSYLKTNYMDKLVTALTNESDMPNLSKIETLEDEVKFIYKGNNLHVTFSMNDLDSEKYQFTAVDDDGHGLENVVSADTGVITLTDKRFAGISLAPFVASDMDNLYGFSVTIEEKKWYFTNQLEEKGYFIVTPAGKFDKVASHPSALFTEHGSFASGRGYLWAKTIPLLKDYLLIGSGPDTFTAVFPNDDYLDAYYNGYGNQYVTRPHNMYLQIAIQTGVLSMIAFVVFYLCYAISSMKLYWKGEHQDLQECIGLGIFMGTLGYMLTGFLNDSTVTVAPIFWCLMGLGLGVNYRIRKKNQD